MKSFRILFLLIVITIFAASAITLSNAQEGKKTTKGGSGAKHSHKASSSKEITGCAANPKVCHGDKPNCCDNKCVDIKSNALHCNRCGKMCNTAKICCKGKCVSPLTNQKNCGKCGKECLAGTCLNGKCTEG